MTNHVIDNTINNLGKTVLWQYDKAYRLLALIKHMQILYHVSVSQFWDWWNEKVLSIDTCGEFGATVWGILLGVRRPKVSWDGEEEHPVAVSVYRKILKGAFYMMKAGSDMADLNKYIELVFGLDGLDNVSPWRVSVNEYGWTTNLDELNGEYQPKTSYMKNDIFRYEGNNWLCKREITAKENTSFQAIADSVIRTDRNPNVNNLNGIYKPSIAYNRNEVFRYGEKNWLCKRDITANENKSFEAIEDLVVRTDRRPTVKEKGDSILLKLIDPNGIVRKTGAAPADSLIIEVEYKMGDTVIKAVAERNVKSGVSIEAGSHLDMQYTKSKYFSEMHRDQQALYEQHKDEFLPLPLGIKTNEPCEVSMFAFGEAIADTEQYRYKANISYAEGDVFIYTDSEGHTFNWLCIENISSAENTSFDAIENKVRKTMDGKRDAVTFSDNDPPYIDYRTRKYPYYQKLPYNMNWLIPLYEAKPILYIQPNEYFIGRIDGIDFIFKSEYSIVVYEDNESKYTDRTLLQGTLVNGTMVGAATNVGFVPDASSIDSVLSKLGDIAVNTSLTRFSIDEVLKYEQVGTAYRAGMSVYVDGRMMTFKRDKTASEIAEESGLFYPTAKTTIISGGTPADDFWHNMENSIAFYKG